MQLHKSHFLALNSVATNLMNCYCTYLIFYNAGSGGNGHALEHFKRTNYPLCVKLGTISPDGAGLPEIGYNGSLHYEPLGGSAYFNFY